MQCVACSPQAISKQTAEQIKQHIVNIRPSGQGKKLNGLDCKKNRKSYKEYPARLFGFVAKQRQKNTERNKDNNVSKQIEIGIMHRNVIGFMQDEIYLITDCC